MTDGTDHIYVVELPGFWRWAPDYSTAFELATGMRLDEWDGEDEHPEEERISIMHTRRHTYVLDLSRDEEVIEKQMACLNTDYDCGHVAYGPPRLLPSTCPECKPVATDGGHAERPDPEDDPRACSVCGVHIGFGGDEYCDGCAREIGAKPPLRRCEHCGTRGPEEYMKPIDISTEDEYYPEFIYICRGCSRGESA